MVLYLKIRESRSLPDLPSARTSDDDVFLRRKAQVAINAGWSSPVARQAHNLKVVGSNPAPATKFFLRIHSNIIHLTTHFSYISIDLLYDFRYYISTFTLIVAHAL